jgi:hypothetical protein
MKGPGYNKRQVNRMDQVNRELSKLEGELKHKTGEVRTVAFKMPNDSKLSQDLHMQLHAIKKKHSGGVYRAQANPWNFHLGAGNQNYIMFSSFKPNDPAVKEMIELVRPHAISGPMRGIDKE